MGKTPPRTEHWSYINVMNIPHFNALHARKHDALMRAMGNPNPHGATEEEERARLFTFLMGIPEDTLERVAPKFDLRPNGDKMQLVYAVFLFLRGVQQNGGNIYTKLIANEYCPLFDDFLEHANRIGLEMDVPPDDDEMRALLEGKAVQPRDNI